MSYIETLYDLVTNNTKKFNELFSELERRKGDKQKVKIDELNSLMEDMNSVEFKTVFTKELFNRMAEMTKRKKLSMENQFFILKHIGYWKELKYANTEGFNDSLLCTSFEKMIKDEKKAKENENETLLIDLCTCYLMLSNNNIVDKLLHICLSCVLNAAMKKVRINEAQKEVELQLLTLRRIYVSKKIQKDLYLIEIKEIIQYHQEHHNLTQLAYQSVWLFLIRMYRRDGTLEKVIKDELHFAREAKRELEGLLKNMDWKKKGKDRRKDANEVANIRGWIDLLEYYLDSCKLWNKENIRIVCCIVDVCRTARGIEIGIFRSCLAILNNLWISGAMKVDDIMKSGVIYAFLEGMHQPTLIYKVAGECLAFLNEISSQLKEKMKSKMDEAKRMMMKRKMFEIMEEEGHEDIMISIHEIMHFIKRRY